MRRAVALAALVCLSAQAWGQAPKPNTLSPRQIAEGWILLFDGETRFGWQGSEGADWRVEDGALVPGVGGASALVTTTEFGDCQISADVWSDRVGAAKIGTCAHAGPATARDVRVFGKASRPGVWQTFTATVRGTRSAVALVFGGGAASVRFRNIRLRPLGGKALFNGKDLTGWKVIPGHKSVYSVTPEGWLNVKNGNGDLQSEAAFGDFVLQLDVYSNGDHLNSGVFFRANPGSFWSGYECQIRNQWEGDDRTRPVDYGTGGLYNRQPARKVVSSDREWFTLTVVAHGYHIAIWNDGYQVVDFTDTRPVDETNARNGARKSPGVLSLQGHDPTTDLSFRNIRAAEMPSAARQP